MLMTPTVFNAVGFRLELTAQREVGCLHKSGDFSAIRSLGLLRVHPSRNGGSARHDRNLRPGRVVRTAGPEVRPKRPRLPPAPFNPHKVSATERPCRYQRTRSCSEFSSA